MSRATILRRLVAGQTIAVPGAPLALVAKLIEEEGFPAMYLSGAVLSAGVHGVPDIGLIKPDPRIYAHAIDRCRLRAAHTVFVDDIEVNVRAAVDAGLRGLHFTTPERLRDDLEILIPR